MNTYALLLRGINVGGKNKVPMSVLKECLTELGFSHVITYIASGNAIVQSDKTPNEIQKIIEVALPQAFMLDSELIKVLVLTRQQLQSVVDKKPDNFGDQPDKYHSDVIFLIGISSGEVMSIFNPRGGVDVIWQGDGVIYSQRLSSLRAKSRLNTVLKSPIYKSMTIRNWNTTVKLLDLANKVAGKKT